MSTLLTFVGIIGLAGPAVPDIRVELIPSHPGPYSGGEEFTVNVLLHNEFQENFRLTLIRLDFEASDALDMGPQFTFDYSALESGNNFYTTNPNLPRPQTENHLLCMCHLYLPSGGTIPMGSLPIRLPKSGGTYRIDALNASATQTGLGAFIETQGLDHTLLLRARDGDIVGGQLDLTVTPPPIPAASQWGLIIMGLCIGIWGSLRLRCMRIQVERICTTQSLSILFLAAVSLAAVSHAQILVESDVTDLTIDSGTVSASGSGTGPVVVFSEIISIEDATWIRLHFSTVILSGSASNNNASFLRITSAADQSAQVLHAEAVLDWSHTSAYMRGEEVLLELLAFRNTGNNRVVVDKASFGVDIEPEFDVLACEDTRTPWTDDRTARFLFHETTVGNCRSITGCTAFLVSNNQNCFLSAGHCCMNLDFQSSCPFRPIVEFNVPQSQSNRTIVPSLPEDQYPVDRYSVQHQFSATVSQNDWCFFGVWNNPITGLSPYAAQGDAFQLAATIPSMSGNDMRVSGYGVDSGSYNQTLQTNEGDFTASPSGYSIGSAIFAQSGVSGAAMEYDGLTYGIATRYQCLEQTVPYTYGTALNHPNLQATLANGLGVCEDCNQNTLPDIYEVQTADCNGSGFPDECDIMWEASNDCNENGIPDECEMTDCNENGVLDSCDIVSETSDDCDENGIPDECELLGSCCIPSITCFECMRESPCDQLNGNWGAMGNCIMCAMAP